MVSLLAGLLCKDPKKRITIAEIRQHPYVAMCIWCLFSVCACVCVCVRACVCVHVLLCGCGCMNLLAKFLLVVDGYCRNNPNLLHQNLYGFHLTPPVRTHVEALQFFLT